MFLLYMAFTEKKQNQRRCVLDVFKEQISLIYVDKKED